jgi:hypothetical protein
MELKSYTEYWDVDEDGDLSYNIEYSYELEFKSHDVDKKDEIYKYKEDKNNENSNILP